MNDPDGYKITSCFIVGYVTHDAFLYDWEQIEEMARFSNPFVSTSVDLKIVYYLDEKNSQRFMELRDAVDKRLAHLLASKTCRTSKSIPRRLKNDTRT